MIVGSRCNERLLDGGGGGGDCGCRIVVFYLR